jgi:tetratricopeptide (TPR) repeat protein
MEPIVISHYRLLDRLGEGGMGVVYRAQDIRLGREVAVKVLRTDVNTSADWMARFEREARLASSLQHPHICTIHELGEDAGQPFIAMERLEGHTVRQLIEAGRIPISKVLHFAVQMADALDAAHRRGIIHRDIKPANLFVTYGDHLKILDFGLAKTTEAEPPTRTAIATASSATVAISATAPSPINPDLTATGMAVGTASYMSPEQAHGQPLDERSDLFSMGSVLYEMATGRRAFGGDDLALIAVRIANGILAPPRTVDPSIPENVEAIIRKLMATEPKDRYQSAAELLGELKTALQRIDPEAAVPSDGAEPARRSKRSFATGAIAASLAVLLLAGFATYKVMRPRPATLSDRDTILIGAFENSTGEPLFDATLLTALKVQLGQSPFLDIVPDQRVREILRTMGKSEDEKLTSAITREICQRLTLKAMLEGSIAALGSSYVLRLEATDCQTGEALAREQAEVTGQDRVLRELGSMTSRVRTTLGESLPSVQRFDVPIEQATTPSLTALKAYALGLEERRKGRELESVAFFNQAIELDREFASAYATLSTVYGSLGEWQRSEQYARLAYERQNRVSERERLFITYQFHDRVTGNEEKAASTLELWKTAYPRESRPVNALALIHNRMGRYDRAEEEAKEALRRSPGHPFPISNLAITYRALGRYADAQQTATKAVDAGVETTPTRRSLYQVGLLLGDGSAAKHLAWAKDRPREFDLVSAQAQVAACEGRMREASELYRRAADMAVARGLRGTASGYTAQLAWTEALYRDRDQAGELRIPALDENDDSPGTVPRFRAAAALAMNGQTTEALALVTHTETSYPDATFVRTVLGPVTRAVIALRQHKSEDAVEALKPAVQTEYGTVAGLVPPYLRGEALRQKRAFTEAVAEYQKVLQHRGVDPFAPVVPLAQLGIARSYAQSGEIGASRRAYDELFAMWKGADAAFHPLVAARAEYARLATTIP